MNRRRTGGVLLALTLALGSLAGAQAATVEDEDIQFEESLRQFGYLSGLAYQCLPETGRAAHEREVLTAYAGLVRLFGSDRAFFYAAAFGAGSTGTVDKAKCKTHVDQFNAAMKKSKPQQ